MTDFPELQQALVDALPVREPVAPPGEPGTRIDADRARLFFERGDSRIYAVGAIHTQRAEERPSVCVLQFVGDVQEQGRCTDVLENPALGGTVTGVPVLVDGAPAIAALAADDIRSFEVEFADGKRERHRFVDSAALAPADPWPSGLNWRNAAGGFVGVELTPEERPLDRGG